MKRIYIYFIVLCFSFSFSANKKNSHYSLDNKKIVRSKNFYNKEGDSKIELLSSDIENTLLKISVENYDLVKVLDKNNYYKILKLLNILLLITRANKKQISPKSFDSINMHEIIFGISPDKLVKINKIKITENSIRKIFKIPARFEI